MRCDLLNDALIRTGGGAETLPGLFAAMSRGEVTSFPALRPHQRPAWHMFLVQLATLALSKSALADLPEDPEVWRTALLGLTPDFPEGEPWHLILSDRTKPGFLQPPDPGGLRWTPVNTPDALDMLITSRNHDLKRDIARHAMPDDWIFALVSLQTMEGFGGAGNYGIARMNGGSSSRTMIGLVPARPGSVEVDPSAWWRRDVSHLLEERVNDARKALLWTAPWPDGQSFSLGDLDPLFIEVCRRIRLVDVDGRIAAERSTSKAARIDGRAAKGNTGDPWAPIHVEGKSFTLGDQDFTYEVLVRLLFKTNPEWHKPPMAQPSSEEERQPMLLIAEAFSRGNSKTDGFRSRVVPVPKAVMPRLFRERVCDVADGVVKDIADAGLALRDALARVANEGRPERPKQEHYGRVAPAREAFRRDADLFFFQELWTRATAKHDDDVSPMRFAFLSQLASIAWQEFEAALPAIPCASLLRPRAEVRGRTELARRLAYLIKDFKQAEEAHV
ncbi:hypothetical protein [Salipiger sp.]|uniref:hypothetical protein n=1 Tax=Salipiger sp. TaxID=2078585 RepID=UPI003A983D28